MQLVRRTVEVSPALRLLPASTTPTPHSPFAAFNKLPGFPGNENLPPSADMPPASRLGLYTAKCLPDITTVVGRARRMRKNHPLLRTIYVITDNAAWSEELRRWLLSDGWERVFVGSDVHSAWGEREMGEVVDMEIARRSGVFVGNGVSWVGVGGRGGCWLHGGAPLPVASI